MVMMVLVFLVMFLVLLMLFVLVVMMTVEVILIFVLDAAVRADCAAGACYRADGQK